jgi:hypothetical protein
MIVLGLGDPGGVLDGHGDFGVTGAGPLLAGEVEYEFAGGVFEGDALHVEGVRAEVRWFAAAGTGPVALESLFDADFAEADGAREEQEILAAGIVAAVPSVVEDAVPVEVAAVVDAVSPQFHPFPVDFVADRDSEQFPRCAALCKDLIDGALLSDFSHREGTGGNGFGREEIPDCRGWAWSGTPRRRRANAGSTGFVGEAEREAVGVGMGKEGRERRDGGLFCSEVTTPTSVGASSVTASRADCSKWMGPWLASMTSVPSDQSECNVTKERQ